MSFTDFFSLLLPFSGKDHIVLSNFSILVCFALGRADVKIQAEKIFLPHGEKIKQETKAENQYPVYYPLYEDTGRYLQKIGKRAGLKACSCSFKTKKSYFYKNH